VQFFKRKHIKASARIMSFVLVAVLLFVLLPVGTSAQVPLVNPNLVRAAVRQMGMDSLATVIVSDPPGLATFERLLPPVADPTTNPPTPAPPASLVNYAASKGITVQRAAMRVLGKALFWDQQAGSDGQACASCHFHAGSDIRAVDTLNPGARNTNPAEQSVWGTTRSGQQGGPNYTLTPGDFPFHELADPLETNYGKKDVLFDTDDAVGSIGTFHANFGGSPAPNYALPNAVGTYDTVASAITDHFSVSTAGAPGGNRNVRSNGPRQAAPTINALFNFNNFWDGRADNSFNGLNMHGIKDFNSFIYFNSGGALIRDLIAGITEGALASQATAPIASSTSDEMAFSGRTIPDVGRKLLRLTGPGKGATATAVIDLNPLLADGVTPNPAYQTVTGFTVTSAGSGYIPTAQGGGASVTLTGGGGAGAIAVANVNASGVVSAISIYVDPVLGAQGGGGYVTPPAVTIVSTGLDTAAYTIGPPTPPAPMVIPLGAQVVSPTDSVLGSFARTGAGAAGQGINLSYVNLIQWAFVPTFWDAAAANGGTLTTPSGFHLMEENMPMFWGLSIQMYETLLRADQSPYDKFMAGDNAAFDPVGGPNSVKSQNAMRGLLTYISTENTMQQVNPIFNNINFGACQLCHSGRELTEVASPNVAAKLFVATDMTVKMDHNRELAIVPPSANFDVGFTNIGSRPTREDVGIGGDAPFLPGTPLSITKARNMNQAWAMLLLPVILFPGEPNPTRGSNIDGAFKIPHLRNVELNGPYFHNGGELTLKQVVEFYARHGDFADVNEPNIDVGLAMVQNIGDADADLLVSFLLQLTDERVRWEMAPFDHPQLSVPNGHAAGLPANTTSLGAAFAQDTFLVLPAVGANGRHDLPAGQPYPAGNVPLPNFLNISSTPVAGPNNDHFDP
jgi:cytochrome c peroxidase